MACGWFLFRVRMASAAPTDSLGIRKGSKGVLLEMNLELLLLCEERSLVEEKV